MYLQSVIRPFQKIALIFLCSAVFCIFTVKTEAAPLYTHLTRLHVIAHSDTETDQARKLLVRDRVLDVTKAVTDDAMTPEEAREALRKSLWRIEAAAQEAVYASGSVQPVKVTLDMDVAFDRREYDSFSLPAGNYPALQVKIGDADGKNWWCVAFPPLCTTAATGEWTAAAKDAGLTDRQLKLITADGKTYAVRFWILDFLQALRK